MTRERRATGSGKTTSRSRSRIVPGEWSIDTPLFDLNYGWGDHIQLTLQGPVSILKRSGHGAIGGLGGTEAAVKWRFLDEDKSGADVSMFPRILFNVAALLGPARARG